MKSILRLAVLAGLAPVALVPAALAQNQPQSRTDDKAVVPAQTSPVASGGGVPVGKSKYRVVRSISGSAGAQENSGYIIRDPRTIFHIPQDHRVIVYFEWEGPLGPHRFEGVWKTPDGKITSVSDFDYEAKQPRFGGYWDMLIAENTPTGLWTLQALVDGELTGTHRFQVVTGATATGAETAVTEPLRRPLAPAALYGKANASTVAIENRNDQGQMLNTGEGFFIGPGLLLTAFQVIDGASSLRVAGTGGPSVDTKTVAAWNRRQDWAILQVAGIEEPAPENKPEANLRSVRRVAERPVGDRVGRGERRGEVAYRNGGAAGGRGCGPGLLDSLLGGMERPRRVHAFKFLSVGRPEHVPAAVTRARRNSECGDRK